MNYFERYQEETINSPWVDRITSELSWWIKITTDRPFCIYYFGPFSSQDEAAVAQYGYIDDLMSERVDGIDIEIKLDRPVTLTVFEEI